MASIMENITESITATMEKNKKTIWKIICLLCMAGAVVCIAAVCVNGIRQKRAAEDMSRLAQNQVETMPMELTGEPSKPQTAADDTGQKSDLADADALFAESVQALSEAGIPVPEKEVDIPAMQRDTNADIYAWIYIPDTNIDYPVLQHPTDDYYYLNYNIDGSKGYPGCIYSEGAYNNKEFTDANTVLYGHNMKNGSMFANLHKYEDSEFFAKHPYVYIYTEDKLRVYRVFAAYVHSSEHLLYSYNFSDPVMFQRYFEEVMSERTMNSNFSEEVELSGDEHILTLSTCIANKPDNRYLVQGVLINED